MSNLYYSPNFRTITEDCTIYANDSSMTFINRGNSSIFIDVDCELHPQEHITISSNISNAILKHNFQIKFGEIQTDETEKNNKLSLIAINFNNGTNGN